MYAVLKSFGLKGLNGFPVEVEADISGGMPALSIVGLPDSAVRESGDRVHAALKNLGFKWPDRRITINLAPADVRKTGPVYDLPLLLAVLAASGQLEPPPKDTAFLGELALDGSLRPVSGVLPMALEAESVDAMTRLLPPELAEEVNPFITGSLLTAEEKRLLKAADRLSALVKCMEEQRSGNHEFDAALRQQREALEGMHCPEADWFMAHCLPCFTQNLDELTRSE